MHEFTTTVRNYDRLVWKVARFRSRNGVIDTEELVQETWLNLWAQWDVVKVMPCALGGIIRHVAHQTATKMYRSTTTWKRDGVTVPLEDWNGGEVAPMQEASVMAQQAVAAIDQFDRRTAEALEKRALGYSFPEIAEMQGGITRQAIDQKVSAARLRLQKMGH